MKCLLVSSCLATRKVTTLLEIGGTLKARGNRRDPFNGDMDHHTALGVVTSRLDRLVPAV